MKKHLVYWLAAVLIVALGCQKELSFEGSNTPAKGSLKSDVTGDCNPMTANGTYIAASALVPATNTISVQVNITQTGTFAVGTDTVNGIYFRGVGTFTTLGATNVTLRGNGTPFAAGVSNFIVSFDSTFCDIAVTILPAGSGPAVFALVSGGTPNNCASALVTGAYPKDNALNGATNYADITVNVTTIGTYTIKATGGGMTFQKSGTFTVTGNQSVRLVASGTPTAAPGPSTETFDPPFASCSFTVTVVTGAVYTIDCANVVVHGTYQVGTNLGASNTIDIPITVTTAGPYGISVSTDGMTFVASGTLTLTSTLITLTGVTSTAPAAPAGVYNLSVGSPACLIPITVTPGPVINWSFQIGTTTYQGSTFSAALDVPFPGITTFSYEGDNPAGDDIIFDLYDIAGGITNSEQYSATSTGSTNACDFTFTDGAGTLDLFSGPGAPPTGTMVFTVTSHNTATKTIIGTFSGKAFDNISMTLKTITNGTFNIVYP